MGSCYPRTLTVSRERTGTMLGAETCRQRCPDLRHGDCALGSEHVFDVANRPAPVQPPTHSTPDGARLRPVAMADVPAVNAYRSLAEVARYLPHPPHTVADTELTLAAMVAQQELAHARSVAGPGG